MQIGQRIFMRAIHFRLCRQRCQFAERLGHLRRRAFENPATAAGKQGVAAKQPGFASDVANLVAHVGNVALGVARHVEHTQGQRQAGYGNPVTFA